MANHIYKWNETVSDTVTVSRDYDWKTETYYESERVPYQKTVTKWRTCGYTTQEAKDAGRKYCETWDSQPSSLTSLYPYGGITTSTFTTTETAYRTESVEKTRRVKDYYDVYKTTYASSNFTVELPVGWSVYQVIAGNSETVVDSYKAVPSTNNPTVQILTFTAYGKNRPPRSSTSRISSKSYNLEVNVHYSTTNPPNAPGNIILQDNSAYSYMANVLVKWGASTDPDGDLSGYRLEARYGTGTWELIAEKSDLTFLTSYVQLPKGADSVEFRVQAFDSEGNRSAWTQSEVRKIEQNALPRIWSDITSSNLGTKNEPFSFNFYVDDPNEADVLSTVLRVNGKIAYTNNNAPRNTAILADVSSDIFDTLPPNVGIPINVTVQDQRNNQAFLNFTFQKQNLAPVITVASDELGDVEFWNPVQFNVSDPDWRAGDAGFIKIKWSLDGVLQKEWETQDESIDLTLDIDKDKWLRLKHNVERGIIIEAEDAYGEKVAKRITFKRVVNRIRVEAKFESTALNDVVSTVYLTMLWAIANGAQPTVRICNNANDAVPAWEDCTQRVLDKVDIVLQNNTKTATTWAIGVQVTIERGTSTDISWLSSIGGAIK